MSTFLRPFALAVCALRGISGGATMTYRSPGRFWFPILPRPGLFLCTFLGVSRGVLYIRRVGLGLCVLLILPLGLLVLDPVLVLLAVGHGGPSEVGGLLV